MTRDRPAARGGRDTDDLIRVQAEGIGAFTRSLSGDAFTGTRRGAAQSVGEETFLNGHAEYSSVALQSLRTSQH